MKLAKTTWPQSIPFSAGRQLPEGRVLPTGCPQAAHRRTPALCLFLSKVLTFEDSAVFLLSASSVWIFVVAFLFFSYKKDLKYKEIQKGWLTYPAVYSLWKLRSRKVSWWTWVCSERKWKGCSIAVRSHLLPTFHFICGGLSHRLLLGLMNQILVLISVYNVQKLVICEQLMIFFLVWAYYLESTLSTCRLNLWVF